MKSKFDPEGLRARSDARTSFLQAIHACETEITPPTSRYGRPCEVMKALRDTPLKSFQSFYNGLTHGLHGQLLDWTSFRTDSSQQLFSNYQQLYGSDVRLPFMSCGISPREYFAMLTVREAVARWAEHWNLDKWEDSDPWFFNHALSTLYVWCAAPSAPNEMHWPPISYSIKSLPVENLRADISSTFEFQADLSTGESKSEAEQRIQKELKAFQKKRRKAEEEAIKAHLDKLEIMEEQRGATKLKVKRNRQHFEWLVRYQIQEWQHPEISQHYYDKDDLGSPDLSTIRQNTPGAARAIGLRLRKGQGRTPKNKSVE
jgi:hypothetical protein